MLICFNAFNRVLAICQQFRLGDQLADQVNQLGPANQLSYEYNLSENQLKNDVCWCWGWQNHQHLFVSVCQLAVII